MDGLRTNVVMCQKLGCIFNLPNIIKPSFKLPSSNRDIFVIFDACHMLKLVRNTWADLRILESHGKLAAQILRSSVAKALRCLSSCQEFKDCEATVKFIENVDNLFDIMNSKNIYCKYFRQGISQTSFEDITVNLNSLKEYLLSLRTGEGKYLYHTNSQDHLELFFNFIRGAGKCNDNVHQLETMFKRVYFRCGIVPGKTVAYIAGWVVRKVTLMIDCNQCRLVLVETKGRVSMFYQQLLILKNDGGFSFPWCRQGY
ncbi:hypothetical protein HELRODRAFT_177501 [Helobdella robusta]|uniref:THAP domain-containing protein n=1 Tax=Helobdella robusta TaxID=6412 RepID=T1FBT3_HELRO|nr:hypothetical protein HELRODRAFT_177501 [Helobdella robusta]ESN97865.1 hypothetical protein HELRODRAFT_177501 [Helobdella robusta]